MTEQHNRTSQNPRVSVGVPLYNGEKYVAATIESLLNQTFSDFELILSDNASTDSSGAICATYAARDSRVKYHPSPTNLGACANFHRCFHLSSGEYFRWNPADDLVSPNLLERAVDILDHDPSVFVAYGRTKLIDGQGAVIRDFDENLHLMDERPSDRWKKAVRNIRMGNIQYGLSRAEPLRRTGLLRNYGGGDIPLICEMSLYGKFFEISDAFFYRRMHETASSAMKSGAEVMALYDPKKGKKLRTYYWSQFIDNLKSVAQAPVSLAEKLRILEFQAQWVIRGRGEYLRELTGLAKQIARRLKSS